MYTCPLNIAAFHFVLCRFGIVVVVFVFALLLVKLEFQQAGHVQRIVYSRLLRLKFHSLSVCFNFIRQTTRLSYMARLRPERTMYRLFNVHLVYCHDIISNEIRGYTQNTRIHIFKPHRHYSIQILVNRLPRLKLHTHGRV